MKYYYLHNSGVIEIEGELTKDDGNDIGSTYQDVIDGKFVAMSQQQLDFYQSNPSAIVTEIWDCELTPPPKRSIADAVKTKLDELYIWDNSPNVNNATVMGVELWLPRDQRLALKDRWQREQAKGETMTTMWVGTQAMTIPIVNGLAMLDLLMEYADQAYDATAKHNAEIKQLEETAETPEEVDAYDITIGYPPQPNL
jgi:hypothetical protein